jgi:hypothetical protein
MDIESPEQRALELRRAIFGAAAVENRMNAFGEVDLHHVAPRPGLCAVACRESNVRVGAACA